MLTAVYRIILSATLIFLANCAAVNPHSAELSYSDPSDGQATSAIEAEPALEAEAEPENNQSDKYCKYEQTTGSNRRERVCYSRGTM